MVMQGQCLEQRIKFTKFCLEGMKKIDQGFFTVRSTLNTAMPGYSEGHVVITPAKNSWRAVVVVAAGHQASVYLTDEFGHNGSILGNCGQPAIGLHRRMGLSLRARKQRGRCCIWTDRLFQFPFSEIGAFDSAGSCHFSFELHLLQFIHPASLVRKGRESLNSSFSLHKGGHHDTRVVNDPPVWQFIPDHRVSISLPNQVRRYFHVIFIHLYYFLSITIFALKVIFTSFPTSFSAHSRPQKHKSPRACGSLCVPAKLSPRWVKPSWELPEPAQPQPASSPAS